MSLERGLKLREQQGAVVISHLEIRVFTLLYSHIITDVPAHIAGATPQGAAGSSAEVP